MSKYKLRIEGDRYIWLAVVLIMIYALPAIYSASTNIVYGHKSSETIFSFFLKHIFKMSLGILVLFVTHVIPIKQIGKYATIGFIGGLFLLCVVFFTGGNIQGVDASRWLKIPGVGFTFQPSHLSWIFLLIYLSFFLTKKGFKTYDIWVKDGFIWIPIFITTLLIVLSNLSTAVLVYASCMLILVVDKYPMKRLLKINGVIIGFVLLVGLFAKAFPDSGLVPSRATTWVSRFERFFVEEKEGAKVDRWQIDNAKIAIAKGEYMGVGPGKSIQKNFLPQSSSDFIFAIIIEEFGLFFGAIPIIFLYLLLFYRFFKIALHAQKVFSKYVVLGLGYSIIMQALVNMGVVVELIPTTGQPLPLISAGGTATIMTCFSIGIILSISREEKNSRRKVNRNKSKTENNVEENPLNSIMDS